MAQNSLLLVGYAAMLFALTAEWRQHEAQSKEQMMFWAGAQMGCLHAVQWVVLLGVLPALAQAVASLL